MTTLKERIAARRETYYRSVKALEPDMFRRAIHAAEAVSLTFNLPQNIAVEIEWACIASLADGLGVGSPPPREELPVEGNPL